MFRQMRRSRQALSQAESIAILEQGTSGVLALLGDEGYPYAVPLSYVYLDGKLYFHSARDGHKLDAIHSDPKASFCVIGQDSIVPQAYTTYFRSAIAFGSVRVLEDEGEKRAAIEALTLRYAPDSSAEGRENTIRQAWQRLCLLEFSIDHLSGKEAIELVRRKEGQGT